MTNERRLLSIDAWRNGTIDDYVNDVGIVWRRHDDQRTMQDIWMQVVQHASELGELVRRTRYDEAKKQLGHIAIWMLTFADKGTGDLHGLDALFKLEGPLSRILWQKFPNGCHACFTRRVAIATIPEDWAGVVKECDCEPQIKQ